MRKYARRIIDIAVSGEIDTIVYGKNAGWKQRSNLGHKENQNFVQLPFTVLEQCLRSLCEEKGILFLTREESYTSKASFLDNDEIPAFDPDNPDIKYPFSGRRRPTRYKGNYKKDGFRGLYTSADGTVINSDLNGSANIGRKAFPGMFTMEGAVMPDFGNVIIIKAPDYEYNRINRAKQLSENKGISKSRQRRLDRKQRRKCA